MTRGGFRSNAGRKSTWASGCSQAETTVIRVPRTIKDDVLELAHKLDAGETIDLVTESSNDKILLLQEENQELKYQLDTLQKSFDSLYEINHQRQIQNNVNSSEEEVKRYVIYRSKVHKDINDTTVILKVSQLATRLSVASRTVSNYVYRKSESVFSSWTKTKDPDDISWKSLSKKLGYVPAIDLTSKQKENLNYWLENTLLKTE